MDPLPRPRAWRMATLVAVPVIAAAAAVAGTPAVTARALPVGVMTAPVKTRVAVQPPTMPASGLAQSVTLINGDRLAVSQSRAGVGSGRTVSAFPGGRAGALVSISVGGTSYEIPYDAMPYLGRGLDPHLFSVAALLRVEEGGLIPVDVGYLGHVPALPGVTITRAAGGTASGYLTASSAKVFGAALARQYAADHSRGGFGTAGLFGNGVSIGLAGAAAAGARSAQRATGQVPFWRPAAAAGPTGTHTLTVRADNAQGKPDVGGSVILVDVDNSGLLQAANTFFGGTASFTVPTGHYFAVAFFEDNVLGATVGFRITVLPQITVSSNLTVRTDARAARSEITMVTPRPAVPQTATFELRRVPHSGPPVILGFGTFRLPLKVSTTRTPPSIGGLQTIAAQLLVSPASAKSPYQYNLSYQDLSGVIGSQRYQVRPASLATVQARYDSAAPMEAVLSQTGEYPTALRDPATTILLANLTAIRLPAALTEYFTGNPALVWRTAIYRFDNTFGLLYVQQSGVSHYLTGQRITELWNAYPLHPAPDVRVPGTSAIGPVVASASRAGNVVTMFVTPFSDNAPGHLGGGLKFQGATTTIGRFAVYRNGKKVASGDATTSPFWQAAVGTRPSVIRFVLDATRGGSPYPLSTRSHTVWMWRSAPEQAATLPAGWTCPSIFATNLTDRHCAAQPLLALDYSVAGLTTRGSAPAGGQSVTVFVSHFQPSASPAPTARILVLVSFNNGRTWRTAAVSRIARGRFDATFFAPPSARFVMLHVTAADATGSTVSETITRAYRLGRVPTGPAGRARI